MSYRPILTGSWTPEVIDDTGSTSEGQTYNTNNGQYKKIGRFVHIAMQLDITSFGTLTTTQQIRIVGLPFDPSYTQWLPISGMGGASGSSLQTVQAKITPTGAGVIELEIVGTSGNNQICTITNFLSSACFFEMAGVYMTNE